jgi:dihydroxy-acid dehydratase
MKLRSREILKRPEWALNRALYKSMGFTDHDLDRPLIAIVNSWNNICPGHYNLRELAEYVRIGISRAGGTALEFGTIGGCDGIAQGHIGMRYILPSRDIIASSIEVMMEAHQLDGMVLLGSCDKIVPGMLMAAARLDLPAIFLNGGPMLSGFMDQHNPWGGTKVDSSINAEAVGLLKKGVITREYFLELENTSCPTCGSCSNFTTANTMCCVAEALGMALPGTAMIPAIDAARRRVAEEAGKAMMTLLREGVSARKIITKKSMENAIRVSSAIGGSTNVALHLPAIAYEAEIPFDLKWFDQVSSQTPFIAGVIPAAQWDVVDLHNAGGVQAVMKEISSLLHLDVITVNGKSLRENLKKAKVKDRRVIHSLKSPISKTGGLAVLKGNLAPKGAISKPAAIPEDVRYFSGPAQVFDGEPMALKAIQAGKIKKGSVVVIRYEGPKGGPGMPEMFRFMKILNGLGLAHDVALITDGRFSGSNNGCFAGHISPEAAEGGPIAVIEKGDRITIDIPNRRLTLHLTDAQIKRRIRLWNPPKPKITKGYLALYAKIASSADQGAVIKGRELQIVVR